MFALWTGALFVREMLPDRFPPTVLWVVATCIAPAGLAFVHRQGRWRPRQVASLRRWFLVVAGAEALALVLFGEAAIDPVALVVYAQLVVALFVLWQQDRRRTGEARLRGVVFAGTGLLLASLMDALFLRGEGSIAGLSALRPLAALLFVAMLGGSVARYQLYRIRPLLARLGALSALTTLVAAAILAPLHRWSVDSFEAVLWCWFVVVAFVLLERPLLRSLRSPRARERARRQEALVLHLQGIDAALSESSELEELGRAVAAHLERSPEIEAAELRLRAPVHDPSARDPARGEREDRDAETGGRQRVAPLVAQGRRHGELELRWRDRELGRDEGVLQALDGLVRRVSTAASALRLQQEKRRSEQLARLGAMATSLAHEVKNPLGAILGSLDLLEQDVGDAGKRWIGIVRAESRRLDRYVGEVLSYAREPRLEPQEVEVGEWLEQSVQLVRESARAAGVGLELAGPDHRARARFDPDFLARVLSNLVLNAVGVLEESETVEPTVRVEARTGAAGLRIAVHDNGPGVPPELVERIFDPFFTTRSRGTGLGLAISRQIVEAHGGRLQLEPTGPQGGASFRIELPSEREPRPAGREGAQGERERDRAA